MFKDKETSGAARFGLGVASAAVVLAATLATSVQPALAQDVPVMLNDEGEDACGTGRVQGLNPQGDGFLAVRRGPSTDYGQIGSLRNGDFVSICDSKGGWVGIVYGDEGCIGGSPEADTQNGPYAGPCLSGWTSKRYIEFLAG